MGNCNRPNIKNLETIPKDFASSLKVAQEAWTKTGVDTLNRHKEIK